MSSMAVGPHCVLDAPKDSIIQSESPHLTTSDVSREGESDRRMEYPFPDGHVWSAGMTEGSQFDRSHVPQMMSNGLPQNSGWEDFLQWAPGQHQNATGPSTTSSVLSSFADGASTQPPYSRRTTTNGYIPLELSAGGIPASHSGTASTPFSFGQTMKINPAFDFASPGSLVSPMEAHGLPMHAYNGSTSHSPPDQRLTNSPFSHSAHLSNGTTQQLSAATRLRESPSSNHARIGTSESNPSSPDDQPAPINMKKRKSDDSEEGMRDTKGGPPKKTAHNMIEKRYRTNLNDKIAALRDSVPSLRVMSRSNAIEDEDDDGLDLEGLAPAHKLNKATVLSKATEYIRHLEKRNKKLQDELDAVKKQMNSYEKMSMNSFAFPGGGSTPDGLARYDQSGYGDVSPPSDSNHPVQGMIHVPDDVRALRAQAVMQPAYGPPTSYPSYVDQRQAHTGRQMVNGRGSNFMNKMMVGSLAGLMVFEGLSEPEKSGEEPEGRGLFALPLSLLSNAARYFWPRTLLFGASPHEMAALLKVCLIVGALIYVLLPLLEFKPRPKRKAMEVSLTPVPAIASPIETRRKAWLTAIQTVWVPQHQFVLEASALLLKTLKLSTRKLIGWQGYAYVWNVTKEQEAARVKVWDIALDAQLTGGDAEVSVSRLVLTLLASGTLPDTPSRLMLKALHIRVLLWEVAKAGYGTWYMFDELSMKLARRYWNQARLEYKMIRNCPNQRDQQEPTPELPVHLQALLELECAQVLVKPIIQRAYNLAWNRPSSENTQPDESTDAVVGDFAISSPLDALAAWYSSLATNQVLEHSLYLGPSKLVLDSLEVAIAIAPPNSAIQTRTLVTKAVLTGTNRLELVEAAYKAIPKPYSSCKSPNSNVMQDRQPFNVVPTTPVSRDVPVALALAKCLALVEIRTTCKNRTVIDESHRGAVAALLRYRPTDTSFTVLSFAAAYQVLDRFADDAMLILETRPILERMANTMRVWVGKEAGNPAVAAINQKIRMKVVERCLAASMRLTGVRDNESDVEDEHSDAGYGSLEEEVEKA